MHQRVQSSVCPRPRRMFNLRPTVESATNLKSVFVTERIQEAKLSIYRRRNNNKVVKLAIDSRTEAGRRLVGR